MPRFKFFMCAVTGRYAHDTNPEAFGGTGCCSECKRSMGDDHKEKK